MKKYLWIGHGTNDELKKEITKRNGTILSASVSQDLIFDGLEKSGEFVFDSINGYRLPFFPEYNSIHVDQFKWSHKENATDIHVGYLNLPYIALYFKKKSLVKEAKRYVKNNLNNEITIFVYSLHSPLLECCSYIKKHCKNVNIVQIIPDLPQFMGEQGSFAKKFLKAVDWRKIKKYLLNVDEYVLYAQSMAKYLNLDERRCMVMEGLADANLVNSHVKDEDNENVTCLYTGSLQASYGIVEFVKEFCKIDDENIVLQIAGQGSCSSEIEEISKIDDRIKYLGYISDKEELRLLQINADILLNLRDPKEELTKYSFPSKIFEYLLTGNAVVSTKLEGIADEYFNYIMELESNSESSIRKIIEEIRGMSPKDKQLRAKRNISFILDNKTKEKQCEKILEFLKAQEV